MNASLGLRALQRTARAPAFRRTIQRRWGSSGTAPSGIGSQPLQGAADNAFNRERSAVKEHAAATSGRSTRENTSTA